MEILEALKSYLQSILDQPTFQKRIADLKYIGCLNQTFFLGTDDTKNLHWIKNNLDNEIKQFFREKYNLDYRLISLQEEEPQNPAEESVTVELQPPVASRLDPKYTFDSFVQTDSNRIAFSFAFNVSEFPGKNYNPLYIYSDVGLGKTHLLYAIGNRIKAKSPEKRVIYLTTYDFMNEYVEYTRLNKRTEFLKKYTSIDVFLIDDIQHISKWEGTSEQFYYIFNNLIQQQKQIVMCSDKKPADLKDLEERVKSRFEWGGVAEILSYDFEGRLAILQKKVEEKRNVFKFNFEIDNEVLIFIASSIKENIRKLEGALNRLLGVASLKFSNSEKIKISLYFAKEALKSILNQEKKVITIENIQEFIAEKFSLKKEDLISKNNSPKIALPRQIAMYLIKNLTRYPLSEIGQAFGGKHHTTVLHSVEKIENLIRADEDFSKKIQSFVDFFS